MADGEVKLKLSAETQQAGKDLQAFGKEIEKLDAKAGKLQSKLDKLKTERLSKDTTSPAAEQIQQTIRDIDEEKKSLEGLKNELNEVAVIAGRMSLDNPELKKLLELSNRPGFNAGLTAAHGKRMGVDPQEFQAFKELTDEVTKYNNLIAVSEQKLSGMNDVLNTLRQGATQFATPKSAEELEVEQQLVDTIRQKAEAEQQYISAKEAYKSKVAEEMQENQAYEQRQRVMSALGKSASLLATTLARATSNATKFVLSLPLNVIKKRFDKLTHSVKRFGQRLKFVILQGLIFRNLRKYLSEFASSVGEALKKNTEFSASLANLKGAFWSALAPAIDAIAPILAKFMNMLANLIAYLSALISLLFGIGKASAQAGAALTDAGKAGKDAGKNLASWDTIQNLDSGSGGGGADGGISPTFGQDFDEAYDKLEWLRKLLEDGDWFEIGKRVGELFNDVMKKVENFIKELNKRAKTFAKDASDFLNGLFTTFNTYDFGQLFADTFNGIVDAIGTFFENIDAAKIGTAIGDSINGALLGIDPMRLAESLSAVLTKTLDFFNNALAKIDWQGIGERIGVFLSEIDWGSVIRKTIELIGNIIKGLWGLLTGVISGLFMDDVGKLQLEVENTLNNIERHEEARRKQLEDLDAQEKLTKNLIDRLYELQDKADKSNDEMAEMETIVRKLNTIYPDLNLELDEQNGYLNKGKDDVEAYTTALLKQYKVEALKEQIIQNYQDLYEAEKELKKINDEVTKATNELHNAQAELTPVSDQLEQAEWKLAITAQDYTDPEYVALAESVQDLTNKTYGYTPALADATSKLNRLTPTLNDAQDAVNRLKQEQADLESALKGTQDAVDSQSNSVNDTNAVMDNAADRTENFADTTEESMGRVVDSTKSARTEVGKEVDGMVGDTEKKLGALPGILEKIAGAGLGPVSAAAKGLLNSVIGSTEGAISSITKGLNSINFSVPDWVPSIGGRNFGVNIGNVKLERLAHGTVVNPGHEFAAILGDNRYEQEIVSPLSTMKQALTEALADFGGEGQVIIELDGKQIASAVIPRINHVTRAYGKSAIK